MKLLEAIYLGRIRKLGVIFPELDLRIYGVGEDIVPLFLVTGNIHKQIDLRSCILLDVLSADWELSTTHDFHGKEIAK